MPPARPKRGRKSSKADNLGRESIRAFCAGVLLASVFAFAFFLGGGAQHPPDQDASSSSDEKSSGDQDETPFRTAAILFMPFQGNSCKQHVFDNSSGRIWFFGYVDCVAALGRAGGTGPMVWSAARVDAIRGGFRKN